MIGRTREERDAVGLQRLARGHSLAFDTVAKDVDRGAEGDFSLGHGGTLLPLYL